MPFNCAAGSRWRCVGCGHEVIHHLEWDRARCGNCNLRYDVWQTIAYLYDLHPDPGDIAPLSKATR